uniref:Uncharacterized protein n=1 Tax=Arundo donax TaxID=35708 RepID=A0A0A9BP71_ARUDO
MGINASAQCRATYHVDRSPAMSITSK